MKLEVSYTDGGRAEEGFTHERNDCTVRALRQFADISYAEAHALIKASGRKDGHGAYNHQYAPHFDKYGQYHSAYQDPQYRTVGRLLKRFPNAQLAVVVNRHIFYVEAGVQKDTHRNGPAKRVQGFWVKGDTTQAKPTKCGAKVRVNGCTYSSVFKAFVQLGLPVSKHQAFRKHLKAVRRADFAGHLFEVI